MIVQENKDMEKFGSLIILAGGKSSRMGFDKQFLKIKDRKIMDDIIVKLENEFKEIIIVTNKPEEYDKKKYKVTKDEIPGKGPLSGIHAGLKKASYKYSFVVACDMPNVNIDYIKYMKNIIGEKNIDGCITSLGNHIEPFHGFYSKAIVGNIEKNLKENFRSISRLAKDLNFIYVDEKDARKFSLNWDMFSNLNTKEDIDNYIEKCEKQ